MEHNAQGQRRSLDDGHACCCRGYGSLLSPARYRLVVRWQTRLPRTSLATGMSLSAGRSGVLRVSISRISTRRPLRGVSTCSRYGAVAGGSGRSAGFTRTLARRAGGRGCMFAGGHPHHATAHWSAHCHHPCRDSRRNNCDLLSRQGWWGCAPGRALALWMGVVELDRGGACALGPPATRRQCAHIH